MAESGATGKPGMEWAFGEPYSERNIAFDDRLLPSWMYVDYYTGSNARRPTQPLASAEPSSDVQPNALAGPAMLPNVLPREMREPQLNQQNLLGRAVLGAGRPMMNVLGAASEGEIPHDLYLRLLQLSGYGLPET